MSVRDRKTKYPGIYVNHSVKCRLETDGKRCNCSPSYFGTKPKTRRHKSIEAAKNDRVLLIASLAAGEPVAGRGGITLTTARERFIASAEDGVALNKWGRTFKPSSLATISYNLRLHVEPTLGDRSLADIRPADMQAVIDTMRRTKVGRSGSQVRNTINAVRTVYGWARVRYGVRNNPLRDLDDITLPALDSDFEERVVEAGQFAAMIALLTPPDALAYGLAAYTTSRLEQIRAARWEDVTFEHGGAIELGKAHHARKSPAAHRTLPCVPPLLALLRSAHLEQGRPATGRLIPARYKRTEDTMFSPNGLFKRVRPIWADAGHGWLTLKGARHSGASWLDAAGVTPRLCSFWAGHETPERQYGAAPITLERYTHALPEDIEGSGRRFAEYLAGSVQRRSTRAGNL